MLHQSQAERSKKNNLLLAASTALTAGMTNVAGAMACYSFTSNVTGHAAAFAQHMLKGNWFEMLTVFIWIFSFLFGAFISHFLIRSFEYKGAYFAHSVPVALEIILITGIAIYGVHIADEVETGILAIALLFSMGIQNSTVSTITGGSIKTSHLTGLFTDLGGELSEWFHPKTERTNLLKNKLHLRGTILIFYITGAILGGGLFLKTGFNAFYFIAFFLLMILAYDLFKILIRKNQPAK